MLLRIHEEMSDGKFGLRFHFQISKVGDGIEWLISNGFQRDTTQSPEANYWTREGNCMVTFKNGIFGDGPPMEAKAKNALWADFVHEVELKDVTCEDL